MAETATHKTMAPDWVQDLFRLIDAGELDTYLDRYYADEAEMSFASYPAVRGKEALREAFTQNHEAHDMKHRIRNVWQAGETTIVEFIVTYTFRDGSTLDATSVTIIEPENRRVKELRVYMDPSPIRERVDTVAARAG